ncbi:hypothetical protein Q4485_04780 [Granulosicoccaceae sp. 1_MG-2023]|nr:hypothetical protein [Granulosicoccaceae sp. 1_MG-2023]
MKKLALALAVSGAIMSSTASAEVFGFAFGRSANVANYTNLSVEGGIQVGDLDFYGARATYKLNQQLAVYGDLGLADYDFNGDDGFAFGGGLIYTLDGVLPEIDTALNGSFHMSSGDYVDFTAFSVRAVFSDDIPTQNVTMNWYGSVGLEYLSADVDVCDVYGVNFGRCTYSDSDTELAFGGGVVLPLGPGEAYGGLEYVDDMMLAVGYRVGLQ